MKVKPCRWKVHLTTEEAKRHVFLSEQLDDDPQFDPVVEIGIADFDETEDDYGWIAEFESYLLGKDGWTFEGGLDWLNPRPFKSKRALLDALEKGADYDKRRKPPSVLVVRTK